MAVTNTTIINKMLEELHVANNNVDNELVLRQHVRHIRLLCDLLLDEQEKSMTQAQDSTQFSAAEIKMMLGEKGAAKMNQQKEVNPQAKIDHEEANGDSLFDF